MFAPTHALANFRCRDRLAEADHDRLVRQARPLPSANPVRSFRAYARYLAAALAAVAFLRTNN